MTAHQINNVFAWVGYGIWQGANAMAAVLIKMGVLNKEKISFWTTEIVTILTGISVILAITLTITKLFPRDKSSIRKMKKKSRK